MTVNRAGLFAVAATLVATLSVDKANAAGDKSRLPGNIELRVSVADQLRNSVPNNRFVQGEVVLLRATLSALPALRAKADLDEVRRRALLLQPRGSPEEVREAEIDLAAAESRVAEARRELKLKPLQLTADQLLLTASLRHSGPPSREVGVAAVRLEGVAADQAEHRAHRARVEVWWSLDSATIASGTVTLQVAVTSDPAAAPATMRFEVLSPEEATGDDRCRAAYVKAHIALEARQYRAAADHAQRAARLGNPIGYYRMAAFHVLGEAHEALANEEAALDAYRRALDIAAVAFPKSHLPIILRSRCRQLEATVNEP